MKPYRDANGLPRVGNPRPKKTIDDYVREDVETQVTFSLFLAMKNCHRYGVSYRAMHAAARKRFNKEVREEALTAELPTPSK